MLAVSCGSQDAGTHPSEKWDACWLLFPLKHAQLPSPFFRDYTLWSLLVSWQSDVCISGFPTAWHTNKEACILSLMCHYARNGILRTVHSFVASSWLCLAFWSPKRSDAIRHMPFRKRTKKRRIKMWHTWVFFFFCWQVTTLVMNLSIVSSRDAIQYKCIIHLWTDNVFQTDTTADRK